MDTLYHVAPYTGYVYPNETVISWTVLIVVYPYITGLVAGAFTVSSFYHVFGMPQFKPVARFALLTALCFMLFVPAPLLLHLGHAERAFNAVLTPHLTSAMAIFGYAAGFYVILLILENWFTFRPDVVAKALNGKGFGAGFFHWLALGSHDLSPHAMAYDAKWIRALAIIGIPAAHGLHGYVGFVFGSLKSREWWSSDLMPVVFLFSAVISGVAVLIVLYVITSLWRRAVIDQACIKALAYALWGFLMFTILLEGLEFANIVYKAREGIDTILVFVAGPLFFSFAVLQIGIGAFGPLLLLTTMIVRGTRGKALIAGVTTAAVLVLISVLMMRWNVVIGGQEISKTGHGLLEYHVAIGGKEGLLTAAGLLIAPLALLWFMTRIFPPWIEKEQEAPSSA